ncbi:hypothetical protein [Klebsiella phage phiKp_21]|nr:hypothetical protein [Klebsiella phage phiKp_21]
MIDNLAFASEMANQLNMSNFQSLTPVMAEYAVAHATCGEQVGSANLLADVLSTVQSTQYSVKMYRDKFVQLYMLDVIKEEPEWTDFIIERRISGVSNPDKDAVQVFDEILQDVYSNEQKSLNQYNVRSTKTVLVGFDEDEEYYYFRCTEVDFKYETPSTVKVKEFTEKSKNFKKHSSNISNIVGYNKDGIDIYQWVHPNNSTYTRCLKKRYNLKQEESFYFKIKKHSYQRPDESVLLGMIYF